MSMSDSKTSTESGISIEEQQGQGIENRNLILDSESNVNDRNMLQFMKHNLPIVSTDSGMQIDCSEVKTNAWLSISVSIAPDSNVTASSDLQPAKQALPRILTADGIEIDFNDEQSENARFLNEDTSGLTSPSPPTKSGSK
jgi:hypothetical protein